MPLSVFEDRPAAFWELLGPCFASKAIRKELPWLADEPGYVWFVLTREGAAGTQVIAFAALDIDVKGVGHLRNLYVVPEHRENGYAGALMQARLDYLRQRGITQARTTRRASKEVHFAENYGFIVIGTSAGFQTLEADLTPVVPTPSAAYQAGYDAFRPALEAARKSGRGRARPGTVKPTAKQCQQFAGDWSEFQAGWARASADMKEQQIDWESGAL